MITRRDFVKKGVALVTLGTAYATLPPVFKGAFAVRASEADAAAPETSPKTLVIVQLAGGNDGLNTLVPYRDPAYAKLRPSLMVPAGQVVPLNDDFGCIEARRTEDAVGQQAARRRPRRRLSRPELLALPVDAHLAERGAARRRQRRLARQLPGPPRIEEHDPLHGFNVDRFVAPELYSSQAPIVSAVDAAEYGFQSSRPTRRRRAAAEPRCSSSTTSSRRTCRTPRCRDHGRRRRRVVRVADGRRRAAHAGRRVPADVDRERTAARLAGDRQRREAARRPRDARRIRHPLDATQRARDAAGRARRRWRHSTPTSRRTAKTKTC